MEFFTERMAKKVPFYRISPDESGHEADFSISREPVQNESLPHRHDHYMIYFVEAGETVHLLDFEEHALSAPALLFVKPGQIHSVAHAGDAEVTAIAFNASFPPAMDPNDLEHLFQTPVIRPGRDELREIRPYIALLLHEYAPERGKEAIYGGLLIALLAKCERVFHRYHDEKGMEHYHAILRKFIKLIDEKFRKLTQVSQYAGELFLTPGHLNDIVRQVTGKSAKSLVDERRILEARRLLYWSGNNVKSIAWELGFEDPAYFARYFKKHTGELPKNFQMRVKNQPHN